MVRCSPDHWTGQTLSKRTHQQGHEESDCGAHNPPTSTISMFTHSWARSYMVATIHPAAVTQLTHNDHGGQLKQRSSEEQSQSFSNHTSLQKFVTGLPQNSAPRTGSHS